jgi:hypothetical protein
MPSATFWIPACRGLAGSRLGCAGGRIPIPGRDTQTVSADRVAESHFPSPGFLYRAVCK